MEGDATSQAEAAINGVRRPRNEIEHATAEKWYAGTGGDGAEDLPVLAPFGPGRDGTLRKLSGAQKGCLHAAPPFDTPPNCGGYSG